MELNQFYENNNGRIVGNVSKKYVYIFLFFSFFSSRSEALEQLLVGHRTLIEHQAPFPNGGEYQYVDVINSFSYTIHSMIKQGGSWYLSAGWVLDRPGTPSGSICQNFSFCMNDLPADIGKYRIIAEQIYCITRSSSLPARGYLNARNKNSDKELAHQNIEYHQDQRWFNSETLQISFEVEKTPSNRNNVLEISFCCLNAQDCTIREFYLTILRVKHEL